jgi:hypothetical protein
MRWNATASAGLALRRSTTRTSRRMRGHPPERGPIAEPAPTGTAGHPTARRSCGARAAIRRRQRPTSSRAPRGLGRSGRRGRARPCAPGRWPQTGARSACPSEPPRAGPAPSRSRPSRQGCRPCASRASAPGVPGPTGRCPVCRTAAHARSRPAPGRGRRTRADPRRRAGRRAFRARRPCRAGPPRPPGRRSRRRRSARTGHRASP